ncbi:MAG: hypothetical protein UU29_C0008G0142 [Candidatus Daviesbacteria bacterium GW2011_GWA2_40_9]|uniref:Glycosyltransferase RgtA/B/C/D-like domain-containing protein n=1 Tax=Candidatus Daviesbacteria bacterium GW2011_GWA2_40_9 TaxID=1618424 RepID=A0A0G0U1P6_9BACT|nr:MAG: hypothetical protein UU29_C0008G0142 [Candidatus Daviesbacteria bacterium GW2011_GWA2_40_9]
MKLLCKQQTSLLRPHLLALTVIFLLTLMAYWELPQSFFQQDEWHTFGYYNYLLSLGKEEFIANVLRSGLLTHFTPLSLFFKMSLYQFFALNSSLYFVVSIILHIMVSITIYFFILMLVKKRLAATILFYFKKGKKKFFYISLSLILIALLFKETAVTFLIVLFGLILFKEKKGLKKSSVFNLGLVVAFYIFLRFAYLLFKVGGLSTSASQNTEDFGLILGYNIFTIPVKIFTQIFFPNDLLVYITNITSSPFGIYQYFAKGPWVIESGFRYDLLTLSLGLLIIALMWWINQKIKNRQPFYLGLVLILLIVVPFLLLKKYLLYFDSRYLYPATLGLSLIIGATVAYLKIRLQRLVAALMLGIFLIVLVGHLVSLKVLINQQKELGSERDRLLGYIKEQYPNLPQRVIFYTESDSTYSGIPKILPFQSGVGQMLLIWYHPTENFPGDFFQNDFLWDIDSEGYREFSGRGFGYYRDFPALKKAITDYNMSINSVFAFSWNGTSGNLQDITVNVRDKLKSELNM